MRFPAAATALVLGFMVFSGCIGDVAQRKDVGGLARPVVKRLAAPMETAITQTLGLVFDPIKVIDRDHAGGEPVILVHKSGAIVLSSHPGYTHLRGADADLVTGSTFQTFVWRSEDGGKTWQFIGLPMVGNGPRNAALSVSDPDIAMSPDGSIFLTSLNSLVAIPVEISKDAGRTWSGQPLHGPAGVDRNWIEACNDRDIFQVYSSFGTLGAGAVPGQPLGSGGRWFAHSTDGGMTWTDQHALGVGGNFACDQKTEGGKYLYLGGGPRLSVSTDKGKAWKSITVPGHERGSGGLSEPAIDAAGNVYVTWVENGTSDRPRLFYAVSQDHGQSFARTVEIETQSVVNGTHLWPWITAKDEGRIGIVFYGTSTYGAPNSFGPSTTWDVYSVIVPNALDPEPTAYVSKASSQPIHRGPICTSGTACQANPNANGDRRLGDFFTATFGLEGELLIATGSTAPVGGTTPLDGGGLAHPAFMKQIAGPSGLALKPFLSVDATAPG